MAGPDSMSVNSNASLYDAFKALTTGRSENRGTIEVVAKGGVRELRCAQHHFYSSSAIRPNAELNDALSKAISEGVDRVADKLLLGIYDDNEGKSASGKADRLISFMNQIKEKLTSKLYAGEGGGVSPLAMSREAIREIVTSVEELKKYSADELQRIGVDALCNPKAFAAAAEKEAADWGAGVTTFVRTLNDDKLCRKAAGMDFALANCGVGSVDGRPAAPCTANPFSSIPGDTLKVLEALQKSDPKARTCTQVCADASYYGCGIVAGWKTQEESVLAQADPMLSAHIKGRGLIRPEIFATPNGGTQYRYAYTQGENRLSTSTGYMVKGRLDKFETDFLFSSLPALGANWEGMDAVGNTDYCCLAREQTLGRKVTDGERTAARACFDHVCAQRNANKLNDLSRDQFKETMLLLMFGDCDVFGGDVEKTVTDAVEAVKNGTFDKAKVMKGYEDTVRQSVRGWIDTARNRGATHLVGAAVGCGVFKNDVDIVAKVVAEEFVSRAGDMKFVYANYRHDSKANVFQTAFAQAYAEVSGRA